MANTRKNGNHIDLSWGAGTTELFLAPYEDGGFVLLDYEYDFERIHKKCGGRCYYQSHSGYSGDGYIERYADLTRVGYYRVDTAYNDNESQYPVEVAEGISLMLPYVAHQIDKNETLEKNPVVIKVGDSTVIYCSFFINMNEVLSILLSGQELKQEPRMLKRTFIDTKCLESKEVEIEFYNLFGYSHYPWEFVTDLLKDFMLYYPDEQIHKILRISKCEDGTLVRTTKIGGALYATEILRNDPCENVTEATQGWKFAETNMLYKLRENEVYIVGWEVADVAYEKKIKRFAERLLQPSETEEFETFVKGKLPSSKYIEFEVTVPKLLFFLDKEKQFANVRKGIAKKVRENFFAVARRE